MGHKYQNHQGLCYQEECTGSLYTELFSLNVWKNILTLKQVFFFIKYIKKKKLNISPT